MADKPESRIIVPLDVRNPDQALALVREVGDEVAGFKIGLELVTGTALNLAVLDEAAALRYLMDWRTLINLIRERTFVDLKFHDIPKTVAAAVAQVSDSGIARWVDVHASGAPAMIQAAAKEKGDVRLIVVTVLTSLDEPNCKSVFGDTPISKVGQFATMALEHGADSIVCSPLEIQEVRRTAPGLEIITPGIRPRWAARAGQTRFTTPAQAIADGADYLVIGSPVRTPPASVGSSLDAVRLINVEVATALAARS